jgi:hypothetical protein
MIDIDNIIWLDSPSMEELRNQEIGQWILARYTHNSFFNIRGKDCMISLTYESTNVKRGQYHACIEIYDYDKISLDSHDGWDCGRYYFDGNNAFREIELWLEAWNQL